MADDALTALLKAAKLSDEQRAGLWDLYKASKNPADLASRTSASRTARRRERDRAVWSAEYRHPA
jgi:hypothetical protein